MMRSCGTVPWTSYGHLWTRGDKKNLRLKPIIPAFFKDNSGERREKNDFSSAFGNTFLEQIMRVWGLGNILTIRLDRVLFEHQPT